MPTNTKQCNERALCASLSWASNRNGRNAEGQDTVPSNLLESNVPQEDWSLARDKQQLTR